MTRVAPTFRDGNPCPACLRLHAPPVCSHDPDAACQVCGRSVGYLGHEQPGDVCWRCHCRREGLLK